MKHSLGSPNRFQTSANFWQCHEIAAEKLQQKKKIAIGKPILQGKNSYRMFFLIKSGHFLYLVCFLNTSVNVCLLPRGNGIVARAEDREKG